MTLYSKILDKIGFVKRFPIPGAEMFEAFAGYRVSSRHLIGSSTAWLKDKRIEIAFLFHMKRKPANPAKSR